jgi:hypothetical protein
VLEALEALEVLEVLEELEVLEKADTVSADEARLRAIAQLVAGVLLQPSGIVAVARAQEAGEQYVRSN